ncbi:MAG TPA: Hsp20 family protein [Microthrixaceae bacterium]|nr:Hsp20 family protein [Microthrixaceae bacterium]
MPSESLHQQVLDSTAATEATMTMQKVPVNVYETGSAMVVVAPFPAVTAEDVSIHLTEGLLRFSAALRSAGPRSHLLQEWEYGGYEREVEVPHGFGAGVEASLANGQLAIRVLRGEFAAPTVIRPTATRELGALPS